MRASRSSGLSSAPVSVFWRSLRAAHMSLYDLLKPETFITTNATSITVITPLNRLSHSRSVPKAHPIRIRRPPTYQCQKKWILSQSLRHSSIFPRVSKFSSPCSIPQFSANSRNQPELQAIGCIALLGNGLSFSLCPLAMADPYVLPGFFLNLLPSFWWFCLAVLSLVFTEIPRLKEFLSCFTA